MLVHATFVESEIEEERNVVLQELYMGQDDPSRVVNRNRIKRYYGNNSYGRPTIGTEKNIKEKFCRDMLIDYKKALYTKDNLVICITGRIIDKDHIQQEIAQAFHQLPAKKTIEKPPFPFYTPKTHEYRSNKKTKTMHLVMGAQGHSMHDDKRFAARVLAIILGGYRTSRLFQEVRERQGLAYYISAYHFENDTTGTFKIRAGLKKDHGRQ